MKIHEVNSGEYSPEQKHNILMELSDKWGYPKKSNFLSDGYCIIKGVYNITNNIISINKHTSMAYISFLNPPKDFPDDIFGVRLKISTDNLDKILGDNKPLFQFKLRPIIEVVSYTFGEKTIFAPVLSLQLIYSDTYQRKPLDYIFYISKSRFKSHVNKIYMGYIKEHVDDNKYVVKSLYVTKIRNV